MRIACLQREEEKFRHFITPPKEKMERPTY